MVRCKSLCHNETRLHEKHIYAVTIVLRFIRAPDDGIAKTFPTMLDMTYPGILSCDREDDIGAHSYGAMRSTALTCPWDRLDWTPDAQLSYVQHFLHDAGIETVYRPPLNIWYHNEGGQWTRDGTYMYPGSLTISTETFSPCT